MSEANSKSPQDVIIAPGVAESIVSLAVAQVEGVAQIGTRAQTQAQANKGLLASLVLGSLNLGRPRTHPSQGVLIVEEDGQIVVSLHLKLYYGYKLEEVAANIRAAVADALLTQACIEIARVDITIDGIVFKAR